MIALLPVTAVVINVQLPQPTSSLSHHDFGVPTGVTFGPDGRMLALINDTGRAQMWDLTAGPSSRILDAGNPLQYGQSWQVRINSDGSRLAAVGGDGLLRLWDVNTGRLIAEHHAFANPGTNVVFSHDGTSLAIVAGPGPVRLWHIASAQVIATFPGNVSEITGMAFSHDGHMLATVEMNGTLRLWDIKASRVAAELTAYTKRDTSDTDYLTRMAFQPDGRTLVVVSVDESVRLWDLVADRITDTAVTGIDDGQFSSVVLSPNGCTLAVTSWGETDTVKLWELPTGRLTAILVSGHIDSGIAIAYSPDGRTLASAGIHGTAIWSGSDTCPQEQPYQPIDKVNTHPAAAEGGSGRHCPRWSFGQGDLPA